MKLKITKNTFTTIFILLFFLIDCRFLYLIRLPDILGGASSNKFMLAIVSLLFFILHIIFTRHLKLGVFGIPIICFYFILMLNVVYMKLHYHYSDTQIIWGIIPYLILLAYFPLRDYLKNEDNYRRLMQIMVYISITTGFILILQAIYYNQTHTLFLDLNVTDYYRYRPEKNLRLYGYNDGLIRVSIIMSGFELVRNNFKVKNNLMHYINVIVCMIAIVYVDQGRVYLLIEILALIFMYIAYNGFHFRISAKRIFIALLILILAFVLARENIFSIVASLFDSNDGSSYARMGATSYYFSNWSDWLFTGLGIVIPDSGSSVYATIKGGLGIYNYDDIGILGIFASLGIFGFIWYLYITVKLWMNGRKRNSYFALNFGLLMVFLLSIPTQSYLDRGRLVSLLLTLVIVERMSSDNYKTNKEVK